MIEAPDTNHACLPRATCRRIEKADNFRGVDLKLVQTADESSQQQAEGEADMEKQARPADTSDVLREMREAHAHPARKKREDVLPRSTLHIHAGSAWRIDPAARIRYEQAPTAAPPFSGLSSHSI